MMERCGTLLEGCMSARLKLGSVIIGSIAFIGSAWAQLLQPRIVSLSVSAPKAVVINKPFELTAKITILPPYHIQANSAAPNFIPTEVHLKKIVAVHLLQVSYPKPKLVLFAGQRIPVYEGTVSVLLRMNITRPGTWKVPLVLHYQGCNDKSCYPPANLEITVPIKAIPKGRKG